MSKNDWKKEKIGTLKNEMTHVWNAAFIIGGGSVALFLKGFGWTLIPAIIGLAFASIFFNAYLIKRDELVDTINEMKED